MKKIRQKTLLSFALQGCLFARADAAETASAQMTILVGDRHSVYLYGQDSVIVGFPQPIPPQHSLCSSPEVQRLIHKERLAAIDRLKRVKAGKAAQEYSKARELALHIPEKSLQHIIRACGFRKDDAFSAFGHGWLWTRVPSSFSGRFALQPASGSLGAKCSDTSKCKPESGGLRPQDLDLQLRAEFDKSVDNIAYKEPPFFFATGVKSRTTNGFIEEAKFKISDYDWVSNMGFQDLRATVNQWAAKKFPNLSVEVTAYRITGKDTYLIKASSQRKSTEKIAYFRNFLIFEQGKLTYTIEADAQEAMWLNLIGALDIDGDGRLELLFNNKIVGNNGQAWQTYGIRNIFDY